MEKKLLKKVLAMSKNGLFGIFIQCILYSFVLAENGRAQKKSIEDIHITIVLEDLSIKEALEKLETVTDFKFAYKQKILDPKTRLSFERRHTSLADLLRNIPVKPIWGLNA